MKLDYWVLWFEDKPKFLDVASENLELRLEDLGFRLRVDPESNGDNVSARAIDQKYDLILMDYDLQRTNGDKINGDELIRQIRQDHGVFTEVVFYSNKAADELREAIYENGRLDGVYCFNRGNRDFNDNVLKVVETTIKKVLDTNNMRGIAMASIANCDHHVIDSIVERWNQLEGEAKTDLRNKALEKLKNGLGEIEGLLSALDTEDDLREILTNPNFSSMKRFHLLNSITKSKRKCDTVGPVRGRLQNYPELLLQRNILGHARSIEAPNGTVTFEGHGETYNGQRFQELRKEMVSKEDTLIELFALISGRHLD